MDVFPSWLTHPSLSHVFLLSRLWLAAFLDRQGPRVNKFLLANLAVMFICFQFFIKKKKENGTKTLLLGNVSLVKLKSAEI